ncbi:MAG TPA: peptidylprolyl isomerase [Candidatus Thalassarchaeaceae archaeon]|jgi:cyclophilin family peptidyl-prolyl cis-trans isomerase|nr:peptidylprolyl isomerase [Candidatus Thalassarchaeaceae archaeon]HJM86649.1 peptidylprolyl isomerase [Candidatus Thalassarchaeaceae archaeon]
MIPSALKETWEEVEKQIDAGDNEAALESLRGAWAEHGDAAAHANTWKLVGDAKQAIGESAQPINRKMLREASNAYESALKKDPKHRDARRAANALRVKMDGLGIRSSSLPKLVDDGTPTIYGMIAILVVGMLLLTSVKFMPEIKQALGLVNESTDDWDATLVIELYPDAAPKTVDSFKDHSRNGRYDGIAFHRVIDGFMVQGGDISCGSQPLGSASCSAGTGGYSAIWYGQGQESDMTTWQMPDEFDCTETSQGSGQWVGTCHAPGMLAMANSGPSTGGSQFYLVDKDSTPSHLNGKHTVFGMATDDSTYHGSSIGGIELINTLSEVPTTEGDQPLNPPYIHSIEIDGDMAYMNLIMPEN